MSPSESRDAADTGGTRNVIEALSFCYGELIDMGDDWQNLQCAIVKDLIDALEAGDLLLIDRTERDEAAQADYDCGQAEEQAEVGYSLCPYQYGLGQCSMGCTDEPSCMTSGPSQYVGEISDLLRRHEAKMADPTAEGEGAVIDERNMPAVEHAIGVLRRCFPDAEVIGIEPKSGKVAAMERSHVRNVETGLHLWRFPATTEPTP